MKMGTVNNDLSEIVAAAPRNCWLALTQDQSMVVGHGATPEAAIDAAIAQGVEEPVLLWAPDKWLPAIF